MKFILISLLSLHLLQGLYGDSSSLSETKEIESRDYKEPKFLDRIASALFGDGASESFIRQPEISPPRPPPYQSLPQRNPLKKFSQTPPLIPNFNHGPKSTSGYSDGNAVSASENWQVASPASMAQIKDLQVQCEKDLMRVRVIFDRPFYGMIFSKGHYSNRNCVHVPSGLGQTTATFDISLTSCGMISSSNDNYGSPSPQGQFIENTVIIQYDPQLQEVWDQARKLRCTWYDFYEKAVTFKPYQVDMLDPVTANFLGDNLRCWMQIQVGKGPHASEVSGIVKIGQTMTMVLGIKDDENKFDMMVRNCVAHDGSRAPIQLVDEKGCVTRPKIMSPFKRIKNFDVTANVLAYAYFQAFKFPDSMNVHFQCVVQVCRGSCPEPHCGGSREALLEDNSPDSYGSPLGQPVRSNGINPRIPIGSQNFYDASASENSETVVVPPSKKTTIPINPDRIDLSEPGYEDAFSGRTGEIGSGRPRAIVLDSEKKEKLDTEDKEEESKARKRRMIDGNGNKILHIVKREAHTERVDVETERIIRVVAPSDVQFKLTSEDKEEVVLSNEVSGDNVCLNTPAFVGLTISFLMILVMALITIIFLWNRIRLLNRGAMSKGILH